MKPLFLMKFARTYFLAAICVMPATAAHAEDIVVSNYGVSANGMPYAVAMAKGYFKQEGANVTGITHMAARK